MRNSGGPVSERRPASAAGIVPGSDGGRPDRLDIIDVDVQRAIIRFIEIELERSRRKLRARIRAEATGKWNTEIARHGIVDRNQWDGQLIGARREIDIAFGRGDGLNLRSVNRIVGIRVIVAELADADASKRAGEISGRRNCDIEGKSDRVGIIDNGGNNFSLRPRKRGAGHLRKLHRKRSVGDADGALGDGGAAAVGMKVIRTGAGGIDRIRGVVERLK